MYHSRGSPRRKCLLRTPFRYRVIYWKINGPQTYARLSVRSVVSDTSPPTICHLVRSQAQRCHSDARARALVSYRGKHTPRRGFRVYDKTGPKDSIIHGLTSHAVLFGESLRQSLDPLTVLKSGCGRLRHALCLHATGDCLLYEILSGTIVQY